MPYCPGYGFVDKSLNTLKDKAGQLIGEADLPVSRLVAMTVGNDSPLWELVNQLLNLDPDSPIGAVLLDLGSLIPVVGELIEQIETQQLMSQVNEIHDTVNTSLDSHTLAEVLAAISGGVPIEWPPQPPVVTLDAPTIEQIWGYGLQAAQGAEGATADRALTTVYLHSKEQASWGRVPIRRAPHFYVERGWDESVYYYEGITPPTPDYSDILPSDSVLSWLTRTELSGRTWELDEASGYVYSGTTLGNETLFRIWCDLTNAELQHLAGSSASASGTPIWPGIDLVTLGTPVEVTETGVVDGPMDGVLVAISAVENGTGHMAVSTFQNYKWAGWLAFVNDDGEAEQFQYLNFDSAYYVPKTMRRASSMLIYLGKAATVTVTPWTLAA